jgi:glyoxylase-like metal-dependent hydrolase (beta-lactamase superfamily II)
MTQPAMPGPLVSGFFDPETSSMSYLVVDPATQVGAVIDPVLNFDGKSGRTSTKHAQQIVDAAAGLRIDWILETHGHADHLSAAPFLKQKLGGRIGIGVGIKAVQATWKDIYNLEPGFACDGSQFDKLFADGETFSIGTLEVTAWHTPGHTPACLTYIVRGKDGPACAFIGDTLFMPDYGTARTDFPGGDARTLYRSIHRIFGLPPETRIFVCHDYQPGGRPLAYETTVGAQRRDNLHIKDGISEDEFTKFRAERDKTLSCPVLLLPAVQVNIRAGRMPPPDANGAVYLKLPIDRI